MRRDNPEARMSLIEHIRELRSRLLKALLGLAVGMTIGWIFFNPVWKFLERPYCNIKVDGQGQCTGQFGHTLVVNGVFDAFFLHLKIAFLVGLIVSSPVWLYQLWAFIAPGLYAREKRWTYAFVGTAVPLFALGGLFAYLAMGKAMGFFVGLIPHGVAATFTVDTYLSYATAMLLIFGLAFEVPLFMVILNLAGVLTHARFRKWRRLMIFSVFLFAAVATPSPDPFSMLLLAVPCVILVELAEIFVWANDRRRARRPSIYAGLDDDEISPLDFDDSIESHQR
ncbi:MAG TPA: twin-arginine translocase subunit TatC [Streptosporangiaceae bacterium]|nr:twin-arginine translocase subunit TatC [Streptosporangiaceae bacterium]